MGDLKLNGATSGTITLTPTAVAGTNTITLPASTGTVVVSDGSGNASVSGNFTVAGTLTASGALVPSSSFKRNRIINGNMAVAQRGTTFTSPVDYTLDRWGIGNTGAAPASAAQVAGPSGFQYALQVTGSASNTITAIFQKIESRNTADLVGKSVTISAVIFCSTAQTVVWNLLYPSAVDNFATATSIQTGGWSATTSAQTFTATITGLPAGAANGLQLNIYPANAGAFTSGTITLTGVQLEVGTSATPYEMQIYSDQLAQCQRYYEINSYSFVSMTNGGYGNSYSSQHFYKVTKRASPTLTIYSLGNQTGTVGSAVLSSGGVNSTVAVVVNNNDVYGGSVVINGTNTYGIAQYSYTASAEL